LFFYYIHEFNIAHCILDIYCKQGITNLSVGAFNLVINIAWIRFDWLYDDINDSISSGVCNYRRKKTKQLIIQIYIYLTVCIYRLIGIDFLTNSLIFVSVYWSDLSKWYTLWWLITHNDGAFNIPNSLLKRWSLTLNSPVPIPTSLNCFSIERNIAKDWRHCKQKFVLPKRI